ncbi:MAG: hypothetical protein GXO19_01550 [Epsilonproteobacteria bacterium]|nr:hypothetical protein [Campylobacterota bacterium]NPA56400.1 hypothetical protein [Campylobacterota bacterium]
MLLKVRSFAMELEKRYFFIFVTLMLLFGGVLGLGIYMVKSYVGLQERYRTLSEELERKRGDLDSLKGKLERERKGIQKVRELLQGKRIFTQENEIYAFLLQEAQRSGVELVVAKMKREESGKKKRRKKKSNSRNSLVKVDLVVKGPSKRHLYLYLIHLKRGTIYSIDEPEKFVLQKGFLKATLTFPIMEKKDLKRLKKMKVVNHG